MRPKLIAKFVCPFCGFEAVSFVVDTDGPRRRRECTECGGRYSTEERIVASGRPPHRTPRNRQRVLF